MYKQKIYNKTIWFVVTLFLLSIALPVYGGKQESKEQTSEKEGSLKQEGVSRIAEKESSLWSVKNLIGSDVKSRASKLEHPRGEKIGTVGELIICDNEDKVGYVILRSDEKLYPVPWWAFDIRGGVSLAGVKETAKRTARINMSTAGIGGYPENPTVLEESASRGRSKATKAALYLDIRKEQLLEAPTITSISLERLSDSKLYEDVHAFYCPIIGKETKARHGHVEGKTAVSGREKERPAKEGALPEGEAQVSKIPMGEPRLLRASNVLGLTLKDSSNGDLGKIKNLLVDGCKGHVAYGLVSFGGFLGIADKTAAVPWTALTIEMPDRYARLDADLATLEAAVIDKDNLERLSEPQFARRLHDRFGTTPYWEVLGFVPGEEEKTQESESEREIEHPRPKD